MEEALRVDETSGGSDGMYGEEARQVWATAPLCGPMPSPEAPLFAPFFSQHAYVAACRDLWESVPGALQRLRRIRNTSEVGQGGGIGGRGWRMDREGVGGNRAEGE